MDEDVKELLRTWELSQLIPVFEEEQITLQALSALTKEDLRDLIPQTGPRVLFTRCWSTWKSEFSQNGCESNNISSISGLDLSNFEFELDSQIPSIVSKESQDFVVPLHNCASETQNKENTPILYKTESVPVILDSESNILEDLLKQSLESSSLLIYKGSALDGDAARNLLASIIAKEILNENRNIPIVGQIYFKWTKLICKLFPGERSTTYYIPACTTASGVVLQARGKLVHQVLNKRRRLQQLGSLQTKKRTREESLVLPSSSPRPLPKSVNISETLTETVNEDLLWLKNSTHPWNLVETKWKATSKQRIIYLHSQSKEQTIETYLSIYPALRTPQGYSLLLIDFEELYIDHANNLFFFFPVIKLKVINCFKKRTLKAKDAIYQEIDNLTNSSNVEHQNLAVFLAIAHLLNTSNIKLKNKKGKSESGCSWKPTKAEARDAFIKHIHSDVAIHETIDSRLNYLKTKGLYPQPYILIVGETLFKIKSFLVVVNQSTLYKVDTILEAVDICYKIFWSLNIEYSSDSYPIWYFLQRGVYKMTSSYDKGSTSVESLLTDCDM